MRLLQHGDEESIRSLLRTQWDDHALVGNLAGLRELHIDQDFLLLYSMDEDSRTLECINLVTHEELEKQR